MARYHQGKFTPKKPEKYVGDIEKIFYRSSWELKFLRWCDDNPSVLKYASEELVIPYYSPVDNKYHRYFVDFVIMVKNKSGELKKYAVEIKPSTQCVPPKQRKQTKKYLTELATYTVNQAKWKAADDFCRGKGMEFLVLTEKHLF